MTHGIAACSTVLNHKFLTAVKESRNSSVSRSFKLSSAVSLSATHDVLSSALSRMGCTAQWHAAPQSGVAPVTVNSTDVIPPSLTVWCCQCFRSLTPQAEEETNWPYSLSHLIQNGHGQWVKETKGFIRLCIWQFPMHTCNFRLIEKSVEEKNECRQTDEQTNFSSIND